MTILTKEKDYLTKEYPHLYSNPKPLTTILGEIIQQERDKRHFTFQTFAAFINEKHNPFLPFRAYDIEKIENNNKPLRANYYSLTKYEMVFSSFDMNFYEVLSWVSTKE